MHHGLHHQIIRGVRARFLAVVPFASSPGLRRSSSWRTSDRFGIRNNLLIPPRVAPLKGSAGTHQEGVASRLGYGSLEEETEVKVEGLQR